MSGSQAPRRLTAVAAVRTVLAATTAAWVAALAVGGAVLLLTEAGARSALGGSVFGVGVALLLTGNEYMQRVTTLGSSQWGVSVGRHRNERRETYSDLELSSFGLALLVGLPMVIAGLAWLS